MTEYNRIFRDAFDKITPASCDEDFVRGIIERADKMEKERKNTNSAVYLAAGQPMPQADHKPGKAPIVRAVAALAATAAVIAGAVFGLNWLNEHGGLKEGGIESSNGAGYSQNAAAETTTGEEQPEFTTVFQAYSSDGHDRASMKAEYKKKYDETFDKRNALMVELVRLQTLPDDPETEKSIEEFEKQIEYYNRILKEYSNKIAELDNNAEYTTVAEITPVETVETTVTTEVSDIVTTATAEWTDDTTYNIPQVQITDGMLDHTDVTLALGEENVKILPGRIYDGRILKLKLTGDIDDETHIGIRSVKNPRNIIQGGRKNDDGTFTFSALISVPEGETDTLELLDLGAVTTEGKPKAIEVINVSGIKDYEPLTERVGLDMTQFGIPDETLEWLWLSPFGLEMYFTSDKQWSSPEISVEVTSLNDTTVRISGYQTMTEYNESSGKYRTSVLVVPDYDTDLTEMKEFSINGLKIKRAEFMPRSFWDIEYENVDELTPVETAVQIQMPE